MIDFYDIDHFSLRLAKLREQAGVSARQMSLDLGQNSSYINRIENRKALPSMQGFFYICEYLKISPKDFFDEEIIDPNKHKQLATKMKGLSPHALDVIDQLVDLVR